MMSKISLAYIRCNNHHLSSIVPPMCRESIVSCMRLGAPLNSSSPLLASWITAGYKESRESSVCLLRRDTSGKDAKTFTMC
jgi:hypothetical protein